MGWIEKVKEVIAGLRRKGKNEQEIETIVQQASDKATVTQAVDRVGEAIRMMEKSATNARDVMDAFVYAARAMSVYARAMSVYDSRKNTNNWRRMHGLHMRRKVNRRKRRERGKRADNHPKNADVS